MTLDDISALPRGRRLIIYEFHRLRAANPHRKKYAIIREIAERYGYKLDVNGTSSHVATVIRTWQENHS